MNNTELKQRLAAILAADATGYSRLMAGDARATVAALDQARAIFRTRIESNQGRVIDMAGDSVLAAFDSATGAVLAAQAVQAELDAASAGVAEDRRMRFRIGIHLGDVIEKPDGTVYGDGVNIAARLEGLAEPGGITVSESIRTAVKGKVAAGFEDQGEQSVKNIPDPVRAWRVRPPGFVADVAIGAGTGLARVADTALPLANVPDIDLSLPDKPSIAVMPFTNMSGDPEQEYFTDGITEDIITELSRFHELFVIARNSTFSYKGRAVDVRTVAKELGVRYVLEGSIRKAGNRIRVTGQLIDAFTGNHIWAEKYDRVLADVFELQEELTHHIVMAIAPQIEAAEREKAHRRRPESLSGYEIAVRAYAKALEAYSKSNTALCDEAIADARSALAVDPRSTLALNTLAFGHWQHLMLSTAADRESVWQEGMAAATQAIEIDRAASLGHTIKGMLLAFAPDRSRMDDALGSLRRAIELNPHNIITLVSLGSVEIMAGNAEQALAHLLQALRVSPRDPLQFLTYSQLAMACLCTDRYAEGVEYALLAIAQAPIGPALHAQLAMNYVGLGELAKAKAALDDARRIGPGFVQRALEGDLSFRRPQDRQKVTGFLRVAAGLDASA